MSYSGYKALGIVAVVSKIGHQRCWPGRQTGDHPVPVVPLREGVGGIPGDQAVGLPEVLLRLVKRPARHLV